MNSQLGKGIRKLLGVELLLLVPALLVALALFTLPVSANAQSGEVWSAGGNATVEPAFNDLNGSQMYLFTPSNLPSPDPSSMHARANLYIIVYPRSSADYINSPLNCMHYPMDNCPDHGPKIAGLAETMQPGVYAPLGDGSTGVLGHDHIGGAPPTGNGPTDFNLAWLPVAVLFKSAVTARTRVTTLAQLQALEKAQLVQEIPLVPAVFQCAVVPSKLYYAGTEVQPVLPLP